MTIETDELICPYCQFSKKIPKKKIPEGVKWATCPRCHQRFEFFSTDQGETVADVKTDIRDQEATGKESKRRGSPWERRSELGLWPGIYETFKLALFSPKALFSAQTFKKGIKEPLAFGFLFGSVGSIIGFFWQFLIVSICISQPFQNIFGTLTIGFIFLIIIIIIPIFWIFWIFCSSAVTHFFLLIVRGGQKGYEATFSVVSYSQAVRLLDIVPFVGAWAGWIWQLIIQIIGLREIHETSYPKVVFAVLIPLVLIFLLVIAAIIFIATAIFS